MFSSKLAPSLLAGACLWSAEASALPRCGFEQGSPSIGGRASMIVTGVGVSASDVTNHAWTAWTTIAAQAQAQHGGYPIIGQIAITVRLTIYGVNTMIGPFPMDFSGQVSLQKTILEHMDIDTPGGDPAPCDPEKNACCDECGMAYARLDSSSIYRSGYMSHQAVALARRRGRYGSGVRRVLS